MSHVFLRRRLLFQSLFDLQARLDKISDNGDPLTTLNQVVNWEIFRQELEREPQTERKSNAGRKPYDRVLLFKMLIIQSLYNLSDDQLEQQTLDRLSFHRFLGLNMGDPVPDSKTIWSFRESLNTDDRARKLFETFNAYLSLKGFRAKQGQIVDASLVKVPVQHNRSQENEGIKEGRADEVKASWSDAKNAQKDTDARWTKKHGKSYFGYKNNISADVKNKITRKYVVTAANPHDSQQLAALLDPNNSNRNVYGDSAYVGEDLWAAPTEAGFRPHINRKAYRNHPLTEREKQGNRTRSKTRSRVEHVFGAMKQRAGDLILRSIGLLRATTKIGLRNLGYNLSRYIYLSLGQGKTA